MSKAEDYEPGPVDVAEDGQELYYVEYIMFAQLKPNLVNRFQPDRRYRPRDFLYQTHWYGYGHDEDSFEPVSSFNHNPELLKSFQEEVGLLPKGIFLDPPGDGALHPSPTWIAQRKCSFQDDYIENASSDGETPPDSPAHCGELPLIPDQSSSQPSSSSMASILSKNSNNSAPSQDDIDNGTMLKSKDCGNQSPSACLSMSGILNGVQTSNFCVQDLRENLAAELPVVTVSYMSLLVKPEVVQHYLARLQHGTFFISQEVLALASITLSSLRYGPRFDEIKFLTLRQGLFSIVESLSGDSLSKLHPICSAANPGDIIANAELLLGQKYGTMKAYEWSQPGNGLLNALLEDLRDEVISRWGRSSFVLLTVPDIDPMSGLTLKNIEERYIDQTRPIIQP